jgi:hypothetical protein
MKFFSFSLNDNDLLREWSSALQMFPLEREKSLSRMSLKENCFIAIISGRSLTLPMLYHSHRWLGL